MTEVPEHLLKRSHDRRAALGLGGGGGDAGGGDAAPTPAPAEEPGGEVAATGATAAARPAAATPAEAAEPAPPEPLPPYVEAAVKRKKIPIWVMPVLAFIPVWAIIYIGGLSKASTGAPDPARGWASSSSPQRCASCHGSNGGGGVGRPHHQQAPHPDLPRHHRPAALRLGRQRRHRSRRHALRRPGPARRPAQDPRLRRLGDAELRQVPHPGRAARRGALRAPDALGLEARPEDARRQRRPAVRQRQAHVELRPASCSPPTASRCSTPTGASASSRTTRPRWAPASAPPPEDLTGPRPRAGPVRARGQANGSCQPP